MGLLLIGLVAGILVGFGLLGPSQGHLQGCAFQWQGCFGTTSAAKPITPQPPPFKPDRAIVLAKSPTAAKSSKASSARPHRNVALAKETVWPARIRISPAIHGSVDTSALVLTAAKASVANKMEVPESAEFTDMDRAFRKNTLGRAVDTICGHVRGKTASGGDTGERPFLYLVKEDEAYVVDSRPDSAAAIAYRNICN
jgi:hypothetical protein